MFRYWECQAKKRLREKDFPYGIWVLEDASLESGTIAMFSGFGSLLNRDSFDSVWGI
jgi:hypothetical protein